MRAQLNFKPDDIEAHAISPIIELGAYEALWEKPGATFKTLAEQFAQIPGATPSDFVSRDLASELGTEVFHALRQVGPQVGLRIHGTSDYPVKLRDAQYPVEVLYYQGWWDLVYSRSVAVVGTRHPSSEGKARARRLVKALVEDDFTIVSGLAAGIDTVAHETAIDAKGRTIAVLGTPLTHTYPRENESLQQRIARDFLLISQVPIRRYERQDYRRNRLFFPERNITMSALTEATIIVEAGETSGTLIQARAALKQGRKLFILDSCFKDGRLTWPQRFADEGAIRVTDYDDIRRHLVPAPH